MYYRPARRNRRVWVALAGIALVEVIAAAGIGWALLHRDNGGTSAAAPTPPVSSPTLESTPATTLEPSSGPTPLSEPVTIDWWQVDAGDPGNATWRDIANEYQAAHPGVTIRITLAANTPNDITGTVAQLRTAMDAGNMPDLLPSWGGGSIAAEVDAGLLKDITAQVAPWKGELNANALLIHEYKGKQYAVPWDLGFFGFWYNKALFSRAGILGTPTTWEQFLADVDKLKAAGIVPYALGEGDQWPGLHLWTFLVLREGGSGVLTQMLNGGNWNTAACVAGGKRVAELVAKSPFQAGYMSASYGDNEAVDMGNGRAAMELMGQLAERLQKGKTSDGNGVGDDLDWFPFPTVSGGKGAATDGIGGSNGIAVGKDAPPQAIDFLRFRVSSEVGYRVGSSGLGLPVTSGTAASVTDPNQKKILVARDQAGFVQNYLDQATSQSMSKALEAATARLFNATSTPEQVCQAITTAAATP